MCRSLLEISKHAHTRVKFVMEMPLMTSLALLNDLMPLMRRHISNSRTHLTDFFGLPAYFMWSLDKCSTDVGVKSVFQCFEVDKKKWICKKLFLGICMQWVLFSIKYGYFDPVLHKTGFTLKIFPSAYLVYKFSMNDH